MKKLIAVGMALAATFAQATTWYVATDGDDDNNVGQSDKTPYATVAKAYASAADTGDEIVVATGRYVISATLTIAKAVTIRSASGKAEDVRFDGHYATKSWCRPFILNNSAAKLLNVCVENGNCSASNIYGDNVYIDSKGGTVERCIIRGGTHNSYSGSKRGGTGGAGIGCVSEDGFIVNCVITNNTTTSQENAQGGGLYMTKGTAVSCFIGYNNSMENYEGRLLANGGGAFLKGTAKLVNCTIVGNTCKMGAGIDAFENTVRVINCVLWDNKGDGGYEDYCGYKDVFVNCLSRHKINDTCYEAGTINATGAFYVPTVASLALNASEDVEGVTFPATDILGNPRLVGAVADLGCAERQTAVEGGLRLSATEGVIPVTVTFTAASEGLTGITAYKWDFDGDGTADETTASSIVSHTYETVLEAKTPSVTIVHAGGETECASDTAVRMRTKKMYVNSASAKPEIPCDTEEKAAKTIADALSAAIDGQEIVVMSVGSPYQLSAATALVVTKAVTLCGDTGNPEDVVIKGGSTYRALRIGCKKALVHSLAVQNASKGNAYGTGVLLDPAGGTVSNCIVRSCSVSGYWSSGVLFAQGADSFVTHCVISNNTTASDSQGAKKSAGLALRDGAVAANCLVANNRDITTGKSYTCAGGVCVDKGFLRSCTIVDNQGTYSGGVRVLSAVEGQVTDCVIAGNTSLKMGSSYNNVAPEYLTSYVNCASDDESAIASGCVCAPCAELFKNYSTKDYTVGDDSVLSDAGIDHDSMGSLDLAGAKRKMGKAIDIGAYEYDNETVRLTGNVKADVTQGFFPISVTFTASVGGTNGTETLSYEWNFGDGTEQTTSSPVCLHDYAKGGNFTVTCRISAVGEPAKTVLVEKPKLLYFVGKRMYVTAEENEKAAFPYDTLETASTNFTMAVNSALDGVEVILLSGQHKVYENTIIGTAIAVHSENNTPEDASIADARKQNSTSSFLTINHVDAMLCHVTVENIKSGGYRAGCLVSSLGGTVSNCVFRGFRNGEWWVCDGALALNGEKALATHCVITNNTQGGEGGTDGKAIVCVYQGRLENSLIACNTIETYAKTPVVAPLVWAAGALVNCSVVSNVVNAMAPLLDDRYDTSGSYGNYRYGAITNCIFAGNTILETDEVPPMRFYSTNGCANITDAREWTNGWWSGVCASEIFDAESAVSPWAISLSAATKYRGEKHIETSETDLAGNPRRTGKCSRRLDPGCYQCPKANGLSVIVR